jgi:hypothetical protein
MRTLKTAVESGHTFKVGDRVDVHYPAGVWLMWGVITELSIQPLETPGPYGETLDVVATVKPASLDDMGGVTIDDMKSVVVLLNRCAPAVEL